MAQPLTLEDRVAIQDLIARYAWGLGSGDIEAVVACFTPDCVVTDDVFEDIDIWEGRDGVRAMATHYNTSPNFPGRQHHVSNLIIEGTVEDCRARSFVFVTECRGEPPFVIRFTGYYLDQLVRQDGNWLFSRRTIRMWDGEVLSRLPGKGARNPRRRPPDLAVKRRSIPVGG